MRTGDLALAQKIEQGLKSFEKGVRRLKGISATGQRKVLVEQIVESTRRIKYIATIKTLPLAPERADPRSNAFDPIKAAIIRMSRGDVEEAFWLVFLSVHFGKHHRSGWRLARDIYGKLGDVKYWTWKRVSDPKNDFRGWLGANEYTLKNDGIERHFGNHRKYENLSATKSNGTGAIVESYSDWVTSSGGHQCLIDSAIKVSGNDPRKLFKMLYESMAMVRRFGRTARFDYLTMVGKIGLAPVEPDSPYLMGATGPLRGAKLLFLGSTDASHSTRELDDWMIELGSHLQLGMQVMEDSLCNWQKSPGQFVPFRG